MPRNHNKQTAHLIKSDVSEPVTQPASARFFGDGFFNGLGVGLWVVRPDCAVPALSWGLFLGVGVVLGLWYAEVENDIRYQPYACDNKAQILKRKTKKE